MLLTMKIITLTGEAGSGKTSIARKLLDDGFEMITSTTTRAARLSDLPKEYEHVNAAEFSLLTAAGAFIWAANYADNQYGTRYLYLDRAISHDKAGIMILTPEPIPLLLSYTPGVVPFFVCTPSKEVLRQRLQERGDTPAGIEKRLHTLKWEEQARRSDIPYVFITNTGTLDDAVQEIRKYV